MIIGAAGFISETLAYYHYDHSQFDTWWKLALVYTAQGIGRGMWESTNKAIIADIWSSPVDTAAGEQMMMRWSLCWKLRITIDLCQRSRM
jgi:hypothetical protein